MEPALDAIAEAGFTDIELMVSRDPSTHTAEVPLRLASERGLRIASVHGPFLAVTKAVWGADPVTKIRRGVAMCHALGAQVLIAHPPYLWERSYARWTRARDMGFADEANVTVAIETMYPKWFGRRRVSAYQWIEPYELLHAAPHVALDTSHVSVARRDVLETFEMLRSKLAHIHLSDNAGDGRDGHLELGRGVVPIEELLAEIRRTDYAGAISLEISVRRYLERPKELVAALRRNREYVEDGLARSDSTGRGAKRR
jgi:sugar phosphate isomerase/epimerase